MPEEIKKILKKTEKNISKESSATSSNIEHRDLGKPDCPICHGLGYITLDVAETDPRYGEISVCTCRSEEVSKYQRDRLYKLSHLDELQDLTFDNFETRGRVGLGAMQAESIDYAYQISKHYSSNHDGWLLLQGKYGCGKTHLAAAIANESVVNGVQPLFITVPDLLDTLRFSYDNPKSTFEQRFDEIRNSALLILDDFGTHNATGWAQEKLFQILNYRYINKFPTVITTNLSLNEIEGRIRSRLEDPELVTRVLINAPDYRRPKDDTSHPELSSLNLHSKRTFGTFDLRKGEALKAEELQSLQRAFKAAEKYAKDPAGWLVFIGPYGSGKTHLAASIANYRASEGHPPLFVVVPDLLDHLRATFVPRSSVSYDRRFEEIRNAPLLVLDDLGTQSMTPWVKEKLYQLFNYRYNAELPTVVTSSDSLDEMDARIRSRLSDTRLCSIHYINMPTYTGLK
jgi:DNA replication protein DnaC